MRKTLCFNNDWRFHLGDDSVLGNEAIDWSPVTLPHDWSVNYPLDENNATGGGGGFAVTGIGWYQKTFDVPQEILDKKVELRFDGVYMDSTVYLNGERIGGWEYGYSSFFINLTGKVKAKNNQLYVRVDNSCQPNSRWYSGSGIYRDVYLVITDFVHVAHYGVFAHTALPTYNGMQPFANLKNSAGLNIRTEIDNETDEVKRIGVHHILLDADGQQVLTAGAAIQLKPHESGTCVVAPAVSNPNLWTVENPYLYTLHTIIEDNSTVMDEVDTRIGIRTATFDCDKGFLLNGERVKIKGMCLHHDCGLTGAVGYRETWIRRLTMLKDMGCNGIRCAHNPPSPEFLDLCDEMGFLVMDEAFDEWMLTKDKKNNFYSQQLAYGYSQHFSNHWQDDLGGMLRRDRNHPSVVLWSIGNEIPEQSSIVGVELAKALVDLCHKMDPTRMVTSACDCVAASTNTTLREFEEALDVVGYNYVDRWRERAETQYDEDRKLFPKRCFIGSENSSAGGERGIYELREGLFPERTEYKILTHHHEWLWRYMVSRDFVAGDYLWTGVDYLGECRWPRRGSSSAPIDTAGYPKDTYYYFRSIWNTEDTTLHIVPHWNWNGKEGEYMQVVVYTNCDQVDLYVNDKKVGTKACGAPYFGATKLWNDRPKKNTTTHDLHLSFDVMYEPGTLRAVGYKDGEVVVEKVVTTTGEPVALKAIADRTVMKVNGVAHIDISTVDSQGRHVPTATPMIGCEIVSGPARFVGMDGGDMCDLTVYNEGERRMFSGKLLAMIYADAPGEIVVKISSEDMEPVYVNVKAE